MSSLPTSPVPPSSLAAARSASQLKLSSPLAASSSPLSAVPAEPLSASAHSPLSSSSVASDWSPPKDQPSPPVDAVNDSLTASQFISHDMARVAQAEHAASVRRRGANAQPQQPGSALEASAGSVAHAAFQPVSGERGRADGADGAAVDVKEAEADSAAVAAQSNTARRAQQPAEGKGEEGDLGDEDGQVQQQPFPVPAGLSVPSSTLVAPSSPSASAALLSRLSSLLTSATSSPALPLCVVSLSLLCLGFLLGHRYASYQQRQSALERLLERSAAARCAGVGRGATSIGEVVGGMMRAMAEEQEKQLTRLLGTSVTVRWSGLGC